MKKEKIIQSVIYTAIALIFIIIALLLINPSFKNDIEGNVKIEFRDINNNIVKTKSIDFKVDDTLINLIEINFDNVVFEDSSFGKFLLGIENYITPANWETYLIIYVNDEYSMVGISQIPLNNNDKITIKVESGS